MSEDVIEFLRCFMTEQGYTVCRSSYKAMRFTGNLKKPLTIIQLSHQEFLFSYMSDYYMYGSCLVNLADPDSLESIEDFIRTQGDPSKAKGSM